MIRILLSLAATPVACAPPPQETAMQSFSRKPSGDVAKVAEDRRQAALAPSPEPVSAAENPLAGAPADALAEDRGRRILSTAFVRVGADGRLTVELRSGCVLVLRDVVMRRKDYCGLHVSNGQATRYCGGYAEVIGARPGGQLPAEPDRAGPHPLKSPRDLKEAN
jgi:hypothetical protein